MDKLKELLTPGHKKEEEHAQTDTPQATSSVTEPTAAPTTTSTPVAPLHTTAASEKKEHGILRQILNPGGEKYDSAAFGDNATTTLGFPENPSELVTAPGVVKHEHNIARQILNPDGAKYDDIAYGTTAHAAGDIGVASSGAPPPAVVDPNVTLETDPEQKKHEHGILRQILNPGGAKYSEESYGVTAHAANSSSSNTALVPAATTSESHAGRDAALAGAGGAIVGGGVLAAAEHKGQTQTATPTSSAPLTGSTVAAAVPAEVAQSQKEAHVAPEAAASPEAVNEKSAVEQELLSKVPEAPAAGTTHSTSAIAPAAAAGVLAGSTLPSHLKSDAPLAQSSVPQINKPTGANDVEAATYTYSSTPVGIGASTVQADANAIANLHAEPTGEGVGSDAPSLGVVHGHAIHDGEQAAGAAGVGALATTAAVTQVNQPRAGNDIADATVVERSYPVGTTSDLPSALTAEIPGAFPSTATPETQHSSAAPANAEPKHSSAVPVVAAATGAAAGAGLAAHAVHGAGAHESAPTTEGDSAADTVKEDASAFPAPATAIGNPADPVATESFAAAQANAKTHGHAAHVHTAPTGASAADTVAAPANDFPAPATTKESEPASLAPIAAAGVIGGASHAEHGVSPIQTTTNTLDTSAPIDPAHAGAPSSIPLTTGPHISDLVNKLDPNVPLTGAQAQSGAAQDGSAGGVTQSKASHVGLSGGLAGSSGAHQSAGESAQPSAAHVEPAGALVQGGATHAVPTTALEQSAGGIVGIHQTDKHERKLQEAREEEAAKGGDLGEKKHGFLHKLLHPGHKDKENTEHHTASRTSADGSTHSAATAAAVAASTGSAHHSASNPVSSGSHAPIPSLDPEADKAGVVIDPRTGLPTDPAKAGAIAAVENHPTAASTTLDSGAAAGGPDWDAVHRTN